MREIKFRVWDKGEGEMKSVDDFYEEQFVPILYGANENYICMQYTGLKDKNGKEIYEGDILTPTWSEKRQPSFVLYQAPEFIVKVKKTDKRWHVFDQAGVQDLYEVIGNIYENPELLK